MHARRFELKCGLRLKAHRAGPMEDMGCSACIGSAR